MAKNIKTRAEDYNQWYIDVIKAAELADYSPVRGCMVIRPTGYALWESIQRDLDWRFKATGHTNAYFPLLIPVSFLQKEAEHVEGFAMECAVVTHSGLEAGEKGLTPKGELAEPLIVRPTSETVIGSMYAQWIQSYRDLPVLINQWANVMRWELRTRLFLRTAEFLWQEGHTAHETAEEAQEETLRMLDVYAAFAEDFLAIPVLKGKKTESEKFPGADTTYCIEALMQDGKALQAGTSHNLGQNFARAFDIGFLGRDNVRHLCWTTSWGVSTRLIGALIMTHSDDDGLVLPPRMAPIIAGIVPIYRKPEEKEAVFAACREIVVHLCGARALEQAENRQGSRDIISVFFGEGHRQQIVLDLRDMKPVDKHFYWEQRGVPFRFEVGPRDVASKSCVLKNRLSRDKEVLPWEELSGAWLEDRIENLQALLLERARARTDESTITVNSYSELKKALEARSGFVRCWFNPDEAAEKAIKEETKATVRCIPLEQPADSGTCIYTGKPAANQVIFAIAY